MPAYRFLVRTVMLRFADSVAPFAPGYVAMDVPRFCVVRVLQRSNPLMRLFLVMRCTLPFSLDLHLTLRT